METVRKESSAFAFETRDKISEIKSVGPGDIGAKAAGDVLRTLVQEQGQLFRRMFDFYTKIIYDLSPTLSIRVRDERQQYLDFVTDCIGACSADVALPDFEKIWNMINS